MMKGFEKTANPWVGGLPVYEPGRPIEEVARELGFEDVEDIVKLASNENPLGPSPRAVEAMRAAAAQMHRYPDGDAYVLKQALAKRLGVTPGNLLIGNGSNELIELLGHVFLNAESDIVMADRAFVVYRLVATLFNARTVAVPMRNHTHDLDAMLKAVTPRTRIVFVGNPNNPTGTMVDQTAIDRFMGSMPFGTIVCFDEAYIDLMPEGCAVDTLCYVREGRPVVVLRTFSKAYGLAGLRIGYAVAPENCVRLLNRVRQPFNVNAMAQAAALAALDDDDHVARSRRLLRDELGYLYGQFRRAGLEYVPSFANFVLVKTGSGRNVFEAMQKQGVIVRPMDGYGMPEYIRVTVGTHAENVRCIEALGRALGTGAR